MHIIALEKYPSSQRGGQELSLFDMCHGLVNAGHAVSLLHGSDGDLRDRYATFCQQVLPVPSLALTRKTLLPALRRSLPDLYRLSRYITTTTQPILYCNQVYDLPFAALLARLTRTPLACHLRLPPPQNLSPIYQIALRAVDRFLTVSHHTRKQWIDFGLSPTKIVTIHNGTNPTKFTPNRDLLRHWQIPPDAQILGYTGRLDRRKGLETLLTALAQLRPNFPRLHLLIAGKALLDGPQYQTQLEQQAIALGIRDIVHFLGHLPDPTPLYTASDLTVIPSHWPEPFGKVVIESMACGTPVVASHTGGIPEILTGEFAIGLSPPKDPTALARTIAHLLPWRTTHPDLGDRGRAHILQNFSLTTAIHRTELELLKTLHQPTTHAALYPESIAHNES